MSYSDNGRTRPGTSVSVITRINPSNEKHKEKLKEMHSFAGGSNDNAPHGSNYDPLPFNVNKIRVIGSSTTAKGISMTGKVSRYQPRKIVARNLKVVSNRDRETGGGLGEDNTVKELQRYTDTVREKLIKASKSIMENGKCPFYQEELYQDIMTLHKRGHSEALWVDLKVVLKSHTSQLVHLLQRELEELEFDESFIYTRDAHKNRESVFPRNFNWPTSQSVNPLDDQSFTFGEEICYLKIIQKYWKEFQGRLLWIRDIYNAMDRGYLFLRRLSIWKEGCKIFQDDLFRDPVSETGFSFSGWNLITSLSAAFNDYRTATYERVLLDDVRMLLRDTFMMTNEFEDIASYLIGHLERAANEYYAALYEDILAWAVSGDNINNFVGYVYLCQGAVHFESKQLSDFHIDRKLEQRFIKMATEYLIERPLSVVGKSIIPRLLAVECPDLDVLKTYHELSREVDTTGIIYSAVGSFFEAELVRVLEAHSKNPKVNDIQLIGDILVYSANMTKIIDQALQGAKDASQHLQSAFERVFSQLDTETGTPVSISLAKFSDEMMKNYEKVFETDSFIKLSKIDISLINSHKVLEDIVRIYCFLARKEAFVATYKKLLAKRLLLNKTMSIDLERDFITRLKKQCGDYKFIANVNLMIDDIATSNDSSLKFGSSSAASLYGNIQFEPRVLTEGKWPSYPNTTIKLPTVLTDQLADFEKFYIAKGRKKLTWNFWLGQCVLNAAFSGRKYQLILGLSQAVVLLAFDTSSSSSSDDGIVSFKQLETLTGLPTAELVRSLKSLCTKKVPLVNITTPGVSVTFIDSSTSFCINEEFKSRTQKIKVPPISSGGSSSVVELESSSSSGAMVLQDRTSEIQGLISSIMKSSRSMGHRELIARVMECAKAKKRDVPELVAIKANIDKLLSLEIIERKTESGLDVYVYVP